MTGPDEDEAPTIVRLPLLPSPAEMADVLERRRLIIDQLDQQVRDAVQSVADAAQAVNVTAQALDQAVQNARHAGASWADIGRAVGIARQSAQARWGGQ